MTSHQCAGGPFSWLSPFSILCGFGLCAGYMLLGASWLISKTTDEVQSVAPVHSPKLLAAVLALPGALLAQTFLMGVLPTATEVSAIAVSRNIYRDEAADSAIASVLTSAITISTGVAVAFMVQS